MTFYWEEKSFEELYLIPSRNGINRPSAVRGKGYKMINMGEIFAHDRLYDIDMELVLLNEKEKGTYQVLDDDLIFARQSIVAEGAGKCSIIMQASEMTCFESHIIRIRLDKPKAYPLFFYYLFQSDLGKAILSSIRQQGVQAGIRGSDLAKVKVPSPVILTQQKIARILSAYDDLIENNLKRIKLLEEMAQITYEEWFVRMKFPGHKQAVIDAETGLPEGWIRKALNEGINVNPTTKVSKKDLAPFVPMGALSVNSMVISGVEERKPSGGTKFINGDTLVARITPCLENGKTGYVNFLSGGKVATGSTEFIVLRETELVNRFYIYCMSRSEYFRELSIRSMAGSDGRQRVNPKIYGKMLLSIPTKDVMDAFEKRMQPTFNSIKTLVQQNQFLKEARDILLPRLMTGMIDVNTLDLPKAVANIKAEHNDI